MYLLLDLL